MMGLSGIANLQHADSLNIIMRTMDETKPFVIPLYSGIHHV